jgi:hypothetical protein
MCMCVRVHVMKMLYNVPKEEAVGLGLMSRNDIETVPAVMPGIAGGLEEKTEEGEEQTAQNGGSANRKFGARCIGMVAIRTGNEDRIASEKGVNRLNNSSIRLICGLLGVPGLIAALGGCGCRLSASKGISEHYTVHYNFASASGCVCAGRTAAESVIAWRVIGHFRWRLVHLQVVIGVLLGLGLGLKL